MDIVDLGYLGNMEAPFLIGPSLEHGYQIYQNYHYHCCIGSIMEKDIAGINFGNLGAIKNRVGSVIIDPFLMGSDYKTLFLEEEW